MALLSTLALSRLYRRAFDFVALNWLILEKSLLSSKDEWVAALDASFIRKSGQKTDGLGMFYNDCAGKAERGLEISLLSLVNLSSNTAYALDARQTVDQKHKTLVDLYSGQVTSLANQLTERGIKYLFVVSPSLYCLLSLHAINHMTLPMEIFCNYSAPICCNNRLNKTQYID